MLAWKWGPALACGNTVVMKPAEQTPLTALRIGELAVEAGFPAGRDQHRQRLRRDDRRRPGGAPRRRQDRLHRPRRYRQDHPEARRPTRSSAPPSSWAARARTSSSPTPTWTTAVAGAFHAIYFHGGQCCTAGSRLFVEKKIHEEFVERLAEKAKARKIGDPLDPATEQGPQVSQEQMDKILGYVDLGQKQGAKLLTGGERVGDKGFFVEPTIFDDVKDDMAIAKDEIFGPVVSVLPFKKRRRGDRAGQQHLLRPGRRDLDQGHRQGPPASPSEVKAGTVWVNCYHVVDTTTPFGGFKMSGQGRENGEAALEHYTETKTVTVKLNG